MGEDDASVFTRIAHGRVSASWGFEATAPARDFRDQYCARAGQGDLGLAQLLALGQIAQHLKDLAQ